MIRSRGMTLVEVLLAIAILSAMTAAVVPLLTDALRSVERTQDDDPSQIVFELAQFADGIVEDPQAYALDALPGDVVLPIPWHEPHEDREPVILRRIARASEPTAMDEGEDPARDLALGRGWWVFEWRGLVVSRWIPAKGTGSHP